MPQAANTATRAIGRMTEITGFLRSRNFPANHSGRKSPRNNLPESKLACRQQDRRLETRRPRRLQERDAQRFDIIVIGRGCFRPVVPDQGADIPILTDLHENRSAGYLAWLGADSDDQTVVGRVDGEGNTLDGDGLGGHAELPPFAEK